MTTDVQLKYETVNRLSLKAHASGVEFYVNRKYLYSTPKSFTHHTHLTRGIEGVDFQRTKGLM